MVIQQEHGSTADAIKNLGEIPKYLKCFLLGDSELFYNPSEDKNSQYCWFTFLETILALSLVAINMKGNSVKEDLILDI